MRTLLLFDLDGTLVQGAGGGRRAIESALEAVCGIEDGLDGIATAGKTDPGIFREVLMAHGTAMTEKIPPNLLQAYLERLSEEIAVAPGRVAPGVGTLLGRLEAAAGTYLGLGTGNVEQGARVKLAPHDLNRFFPTGGFGTDAENRDELIRIGIEKAKRHYGLRFERVIVVGDTPLDIACARANGAHCVAVATGVATYEELAPFEPDLLFRDLSDTERVLGEIRELV